MLTDGLTWSTIIAVYLAIHKIVEGKKKRKTTERMEARQIAIMKYLHVPWDWDAERRSSRADMDPRLYRWLCVAIYHARSVGLSIRRWGIARLELRRRKNVTISKAWLAGIIAFLLGKIAQNYGLTFNDQTADMIADILINYIIPLVVAWLNRNKTAPAAVAQAAVKPQDVDPNKFIAG
jgi:hypothetical protein